MMRKSILIAGLSAGAAVASVPVEERIIGGPRHFCGFNFAMDVAADERASWQEGPDFYLYSLQSARGGFGIYEGFAPDKFQNSLERMEVAGRQIERLRAPDGSFSYLIGIPTIESPSSYIHLYGRVWRGDATDLPMLARIKVGGQREIGCDGPTFREDPQ